MHIYRGKFNLGRYAENEAITLIVPNSFLPDNPVYFSWKWTTTPSTCSDSHFFDIGTIAVEDYRGKPKTKITFLHEDYHFDTIVGSDPKSIILILKYVEGRAEDPVPLYLVYVHSERAPVESSSLRLFSGKLNCYHTEFGASAVDETLLVVMPGPVSDEQPLCALWQWVDDGSVKLNMDCVERIRAVAETPRISFVHENAYVFDAEMSDDGTTLAMTMKPTKLMQREVVLDVKLREIVPTAVAFNVLSTTTSIIENNSTEVLYCTLRSINKDQILDTVFNVGSMILSLAGLPSVVTTLKILNPTRKAVTRFIDGLGVASSGGGAIAGGASLKDYFEADDSVVAMTLFPGDKVSRIASDGTDNTVQLIRAYVTPDNTIKIVSLEKERLGKGRSFVSNFLSGVEPGMTTTELLQFGLPPVTGTTKHIRSDHRLTTFSQLKPNYHPTTDEPPIIPKLPDIIPPGFLCSMKKTTPTTQHPRGIEIRQYHTLHSLIRAAGTSSTELGKRVFSYNSDLAVEHNPMPKADADDNKKDPTETPLYELESLRDGRPVLILKNCQVTIPDRQGGYTTITGKTDAASKVLKLIYNNPKNGTVGSTATYHWAYRVAPSPHVDELWGFHGVSGGKVSYSSGSTTYLVASSGPVAFRKIHVVNKT